MIGNLPAAENLARLRLLRRAKDLMDRDWPEPIDLDAVAAHAGYSRYHFIRLFKQAYHETPGQYLSRRRVERSQELLRSANRPATATRRRRRRKPSWRPRSSWSARGGPEPARRLSAISMHCSEMNGAVGVGISPVWLSVLLVLWLTTVLLVVIPGRSPRRRPVIFVFLFASGAATLSGYAVRHAVDQATGIPDGTIAAGHILGVAAVAAVLELMVTLSGSDGGAGSIGSTGSTGSAAPRRRTIRTAQSLLVLDMVLLAALFVGIPRELDHPDFGCWHARSVLVLSYELLYQAALGTGLAVGIMAFRPRVGSVGKPLLRRALRMQTAGFAVGLAYVAVRCWYLVTHAFALPYPLDGRYGFVPVVLLEAALGLFGLGAFTMWGYRTGQLLRRLSWYHRLRPL